MRTVQRTQSFILQDGAQAHNVELAVGGLQIQAYPVSPEGTVRNETPLNLVILARFDPADLSEETRARAAEGVVAYTAICTH